MTCKERALACIEGRPVDKVPVHHLQFSGDAARVILGREAYVGGAYLQWRAIRVLCDAPDEYPAFLARCEQDAVAIARACGHDILRLRYWGWTRGRPARKIDDYNFDFGDLSGRWYRLTYDPRIELLTRKDYVGSTGISQPGHTPEVAEPTEESLLLAAKRAEQDADAYRPAPGPDKSLKADCEKYPDDLIKLGGATIDVNMNSVADMLAIAMYPDLVARINLARARRIAADVPRMAESGVKVNFTGCDFCSKDGPCISPASFRRVVTPGLKLIADACHRAGMKYFYAGDGNFWPVAEGFFDIAGVDGYYETDRSSGMELRPLRERFPKVTFIGNIRVQVLHLGTEDDVKRETMDCLQAAHELGGVIVGASNMIMPGTPPRNILTMLRVIEENR